VEIGPCPSDFDDGRSLWWRGERVHRPIIANLSALQPQFAAERDPLEREWFSTGADSAEAFRQADAFTDRWIDRLSRNNGAIDTRPGFVRRYWRKRNRSSQIGIRH
jgi:hypothetical protein